MSENRFYAVPVIVALLVLGSLTAWQVAASADVTPAAAGSAAGGLASRVRSASRDTVPLEECFDVSLSELAGCRLAGQGAVETGQAPSHGRTAPPDECFDVPLSEVCDSRNHLAADERSVE
jgi:hypothetical protein